MKKLIFVFVLFVVLLSSCSDNNETDGGKPGEKELKLKLDVKLAEENIFELVSFTLKAEKSFTMSDVRSIYDSITWRVKGLDGSFLVWSATNSGSSFVFKWGHNFFLPGEYETYLTGYKEDRVIPLDTVSIQIVDKKDFLRYDWDNITEKGKISIGYCDVLKEYDTFATHIGYKNNIPSISLFCSFPFYLDSLEKELAFNESTKSVLAAYVTSLYGNPAFDLSDEILLAEKQEELFMNKVEKAIPEAIWVTLSSHIALLKIVEEDGYFSYKIYAEPAF